MRSEKQVGQGMASGPSLINGRVRRPRRGVEDGLAEQLRLLVSVINSVSVALLILDEGQRCRFMNPAAEQLTGYRFDEAQGHPLHDLVHYTKPGGRHYPLAECSIDRVSPENNHMKGEEIFVHRDGHCYPIAFTASPIRDKAGKPVGMILEVHDISEQKAMEEALGESDAMFHNILEHQGCGIVIAKLDGNFIQCNPAYCAMLGYTENELRYLKLFELVHPEDRVGTLAEIKRLTMEEVPNVEIENRYVRKNREPVWVHQFGFLLRDQTSEPKYLLVSVTNGTERSQTEHGLREAQVRLRAMANELNLAEQRERKRLANELHDHLQQMLVVGKLTIGQGMRFSRGLTECEMVLKKLDDILSDALTYSRTLVAELSPPVLHNLGLAAALIWLVEYMKKKYEQTVTVVVSEGQGLKLPEDHASLLFQSVRELLINSSKHAGTKEATVRMEQRDEQLQIEVRDEGAGFDLAATMTGTSSGGISSRFGLLSIQERLLALGGSFTIDSALGQGTTARLSLRLARNGRVADGDSGSPDRESRPADVSRTVIGLEE